MVAIIMSFLLLFMHHLWMTWISVSQRGVSIQWLKWIYEHKYVAVLIDLCHPKVNTLYYYSFDAFVNWWTRDQL